MPSPRPSRSGIAGHGVADALEGVDHLAGVRRAARVAGRVAGGVLLEDAVDHAAAGRRSAGAGRTGSRGRAAPTSSGVWSRLASTRSTSSVMLPRRSHAIALSQASESTGVHGSGS